MLFRSAHAVRASLRLIRGDEGEQRQRHLAALIAAFRRGVPEVLGDLLNSRGWQLAASQTAIQPLIVGRSEDALAISAALESQGLWVPAIRPPTVPAGSARLRITLSAAHDLGDVERLLSALKSAEGDRR